MSSVRFTAAEAVDDCASTKYCCGSAAGTYAGTLRCHLNLLPGNHEDGMIADMALLAATAATRYPGTRLTLHYEVKEHHGTA